MRKLAFEPGESLIHKLYPVTKLLWLLLASCLLFIINNGYLLISVASAFLLLLIKIHPQIWRVRGFRVVLATGWFLFLLYVIFVKGGHILLDPGPQSLVITSKGIETGLIYCGRFFTIVFLSYIFILTTDPSKLAYALMKIGIPYRFGFMLVTALRLAPILEEEGRTIYQAQLVRGIRYDRAGPRKILLLAQQFLTPLLVSSLRRADRLFFSMEGRGFGRYDQRTFRDRTRPTRLDLFCSLGLFIFFSIVTLIDSGAIFSL